MSIDHRMKIAVILPTLNEKNNLKRIIPRIAQIKEVKFIVIVDDNSTDGSKEYFQSIKSAKVIIIQRPLRLGIGSAHLEGMKFAQQLGAQLIVTMDADGTHRIEDLQKMINHSSDYDLLVGSRYLKGGTIRGWGLTRNLMTRLGHVATMIFFGSVLDMSSGMRAYRTSKIPFDKLNANCPPDYSFFFVSLLVFRNASLKIVQLPITLDSRGDGKSKMNPLLMLRGVITLLKYGIRLRSLN